MTTEKEGFIVHPFETGDSKYHASYGNHNKTSRSFNTLKQAKSYLKRQGYNKAMYDAPSGIKTVNTNTTRKTTVRRTTPKKKYQSVGHHFLNKIMKRR